MQAAGKSQIFLTTQSEDAMLSKIFFVFIKNIGKFYLKREFAFLQLQIDLSLEILYYRGSAHQRKVRPTCLMVGHHKGA